ncbi:hypothetical protein O1W68_03635 [Rhodococcus sp. H36-A4]|uniref:hypothetical protein n=1 Tax=Rhodococcus sp. H36-A4 TaxID=3004353 RepID=UPI0022B0313A|nr:hypothetical protein [Rhodococcus sp. H36-A4]MCZ4077025.1 hypothetical protein [Rhodococcus sp. H36-A4]
MATLIRDRSAIVQTAEGQFRIRPDTADEDPWRLTSDALTDVRDGAIHVATGATYGPVRVTVEEWTGPAPVDGECWDVICERSLNNLASEDPHFPSSSVWMGNINDSEPEVLVTDVVGHVRIRLHAVGRDLGRAHGDTTEPVERYLLQVWAEQATSEPAHIYGSDAVMIGRLGAGNLSVRHNETPGAGEPTLAPPSQPMVKDIKGKFSSESFPLWYPR